jgi:hypothetical protein
VADTSRSNQQILVAKIGSDRPSMGIEPTQDRPGAPQAAPPVARTSLREGRSGYNNMPAIEKQTTRRCVFRLAVNPRIS